MALLSCGTIGADEAVRRARARQIQLLDATWTLPGENASHGSLAGTTAVLDTAAIKAIPVAERTPSALADIYQASGLSNGPQIAVYDRAGLFSSPWAWWMLLECGMSSLLVQGWSDEGEADIGTGDFRARPAKAESATLDDVLRGDAQIVDARGPGRFSATEPEPRKGLRGGHIPSSLNVPYRTLKEGNRFKRPGKLWELFDSKGLDLRAPIITTCGSGVTASALAFCLPRAGATDVRVYMGSWAEYGASDHPVETGP